MSDIKVRKCLSIVATALRVYRLVVQQAGRVVRIVPARGDDRLLLLVRGGCGWVGPVLRVADGVTVSSNDEVGQQCAEHLRRKMHLSSGRLGALKSLNKAMTVS